MRFVLPGFVFLAKTPEDIQRNCKRKRLPAIQDQQQKIVCHEFSSSPQCLTVDIVECGHRTR